MQTETRMAIATMIDATSTLNRSLEVIKVNMRSFPITPEPAQEIKNLSFTSQARDALSWRCAPPSSGLPSEVLARLAGRSTLPLVGLASTSLLGKRPSLQAGYPALPGLPEVFF